MRNHTNGFKTEIAKLGRQQSAEITYTIDDEEITLTDKDLISITYSCNGALLKSVMQCLEVETNIEIPVGTELSFKWGIKVNNSIEYLDFSNFIVKEVEKQEDSNSYLIRCYDYLLKSMVDYESMNLTYPVTIREYISAICEHLGINFANSSEEFANYDKQIMNELYLDSEGKSLGYTFRDVLDELSEVTASCVCINKDNELEIRYINETNDTIDGNYLKDINVNFGEKYGPINVLVLSRSANSDNIYYPSTVPENPVEFRISDNQIMNFNNRDEFMPDIYNVINGINFYINDYVSTGIGYYELLDGYGVQIGDTVYNCLMLNDELNITQGIEENIYTEMPENTETEYKYADKTDKKINQTNLIVNKQEQRIQGLITQIGDRSEKQTSITQDIDNIELAIGDIEDLTRYIEGIDTVTTSEETIEGGFLELHIYGNNTVFDYLYPNDDLYPSDDLYPMGSSIIKVNNETFDLGITEVLRQNGIVRDEYILDSEGARIVRRLNENGEILQTPIIEVLETPVFQFVGGENTIELLDYTAQIKVVYAIKSNLTNLFATKVEMNSSIKQSANAIELSVNKRLTGVSDEDGKVTSGSILLAINNDESQATIQADKINLNGAVTANQNFKVNLDGSISTKNIKMNTESGLMYMTYDNGNTAMQFTSTSLRRFLSNGNNWIADGISYIDGNPYGTAIWLYDAKQYAIIDGLHNLSLLTLYRADSGQYSGNANAVFYSNINVWGSGWGTGVNNSIFVQGYEVQTNASDRRLKENIEDCKGNALETVNKIQIRQFNWRTDKHLAQGGQKVNYGFVAQEVKKIDDTLVNYNEENDTYQMNLLNIVAMQMKAIQELNDKNKDLENRIKELERRLDNGQN